MEIAITVAAGRNGVIGVEGGLPWRLSTDMRRFRTLTIGKPVIMGRKTFESMPGALKERVNIIVTRDRTYQAADAIVVHSIEEAVGIAKTAARESGVREIHCIGGGQIYRDVLPIADRIYMTHVDASPQGDTYFPDPDPEIWKPVHDEFVPAGEKDSLPSRFTIYVRRNP